MESEVDGRKQTVESKKNGERLPFAVRRPPSAAGFTLMELLIAMTILLVGLSAIYHLNNASRTTSVATEELAIVQLACQTKMNELLASKTRPIQAGSVGMIPNVNGWNMSVATFPLNRQGIYGVRITAKKRGAAATDVNGSYELVRWFLE
ncbi:MAG: prepilin-type N-terminal cleavage/methylation domain-containing protein [Planctomycetaceae bacterium]|nr:prepilin-type N-terminal cleavage/methylation domain-containing protein [Planctomycetaceae bacterium]